MKVSSTAVLKSAIRHYKFQPHSSMSGFVCKHISGTTEGVSLILALTECEKALAQVEALEQKLRDIGRICYN